MSAKAGATAQIKLTAELRAGYHCNSNTPSDDYLIPLKLTWTAAPLEVAGVDYPKPQMEKYSFSDKPLSVYTGNFDLVTRFKVPASAPAGTRGDHGQAPLSGLHGSRVLPAEDGRPQCARRYCEVK